MYRTSYQGINYGPPYYCKHDLSSTTIISLLIYRYYIECRYIDVYHSKCQCLRETRIQTKIPPSEQKGAHTYVHTYVHTYIRTKTRTHDRNKQVHTLRTQLRTCIQTNTRTYISHRQKYAHTKQNTCTAAQTKNTHEHAQQKTTTTRDHSK